MSGGYFDYTQFRIQDAETKLEEFLVKADFHEDEPPEVIEKYVLALGHLKKARTALHLVDLNISGDTSSDRFLERWETEVNNSADHD
jgi:hypothetical protein